MKAPSMAGNALKRVAQVVAVIVVCASPVIAMITWSIHQFESVGRERHIDYGEWQPGMSYPDLPFLNVCQGDVAMHSFPSRDSYYEMIHLRPDCDALPDLYRKCVDWALTDGSVARETVVTRQEANQEITLNYALLRTKPPLEAKATLGKLFPMLNAEITEVVDAAEHANEEPLSGLFVVVERSRGLVILRWRRQR